MHTNNERGIALVLALFLITAMSILGASLMFLSQTETYASMNYRMMSQSRYAAESGVHKTAHFLLDLTQYDPMAPTDPLSNYDLTKSPVTYGGNPVVLSWDSSASNYPVAAVKTAFAAAAQGTLVAGNVSMTYKTTATLLSMEVFDAYGGTPQVLQTWKILSEGSQGSGSRAALVQVESSIESEKVPANSYAAFATSPTCDALYLHGNALVDSYDSTGMTSGSSPTTTFSGGDIGSNGNIHIQGSMDLGGNMYSPRTGVGGCAAGSITAETITGGGMTQNGSLMQLPHALVYPPPFFPVAPPTNTVTINAALLATGQAAACTSLGLTGGTNCTISGSTIVVNGGGTDVTLPSVVVAGGYKLVVVGHQPAAQNVNINSFIGDLQINANLGALDTGESVVLKVAGKNADGTEMADPFDLGAWTINSNFAFDGSTLQLAYGGHGTFKMGGNNSAAASIYAPNSAFTLRGTADLFGSILAATIDNGGTPSIHYDRRLGRDFMVAGHPMLGTFSWKRF